MSTTISLSVAEFEEAAGAPLRSFTHQCHRASLALVRSGILGDCRVARGACSGVGGQHSWVVLGHDCYDRTVNVIDPTLWSYDKTVEGIWVGPTTERPHEPKGMGSIWAWGRPNDPKDEPYELKGDFSPHARMFLDLLGPLDMTGWRQLAHAPVEDWPSDEIFAAMYRDPKLSAWVPIDIVGMATDLNPQLLYLRQEELS